MAHSDGDLQSPPILSRAWSRRQLIQRGGLFGLVAIGSSLLAACSSAPAATATNTPATAAALPTQAATTVATTAAGPTTVATAAAAPTTGATPAAQATVAGPVGQGTANMIKIVSSLPRTGSSKGQTDTIVNSINMAIADAGGKVGNYTIQYEDWDDATAAAGQWDAATEANNANKAAPDPDIMAYIGTFNSGAAKISIPILNKVDLLMCSPANTAIGLTKNIPGAGPGEPGVYYPTGKRNYTRVVPADDLQGAAAANWAKDLGAKSVGVLDDTQLYGAGLAGVFVTKAKSLGMTVTGSLGIDPKASDYRALALQLKQANVDLVFYGGITQNNAGKLWQDLRSVLGPNVKLMGPDGIFEQAFLDAAGSAAEGSYITFGGVPPNKLTGKGATWYAAYKTQFKSEPEAYAAYGYDAAAGVLNAIKTAGTKDREAIRAAMFATKNFPGVLGTWSIDQNGDTSLTTLSGQIVTGGKFVFAKTLSAG